MEGLMAGFVKSSSFITEFLFSKWALGTRLYLLSVLRFVIPTLRSIQN